MKKNMLFIVLIVVIILTSISAINAEDTNIDLNQTDTDSDLDMGSNNNFNTTDDSNELSDENITNITKKLTSINSSSIKLFYKNGTRFSITLSDENNTTLSNQTINFIINGVYYNRTTNIEGRASIAINLPVGNFTIITIFNGTDLYEKSQTNESIIVLPTITANDLVKYYKNDTQFYASFLDNHGNPLINSSVSFNINGVFYNRTTNGSGVAKLTINLGVGEYTLTSIQNTNCYQISNKIKVLPTIKADDIVKYYKNGTQFYAYFLNDNGGALINSSVSFNINGVFYNRTTNGSGVAKLTINLGVGHYILTAIQNSNAYQESYNVTVLSTIKADDIVKYYRNSTQYSAYFLDNQGIALSNCSVCFNINGVLYNRTTNSEGMAKLNINLSPGEYILTAIQSNNGFQSSNIIKVLSTIEGIDLVKAFQDKNQYCARFLENNGKPLQGININFNINGIIYNRTTDSQGMAKLNINLAPGNYILTAYNSHDNLFASNNIKVLTNVSTKIEAKNNTFMEDKPKSISVALYDELGYALENKQLEMIVNDEVFTATSNNDGIATFVFDLVAGLYDVEYKYKGNEVYKASNNNKSIRILNGEDVNIEVLDSIVYSKDTFSIKVKNLTNTTLKNIGVTFIANNKVTNVFTDNNGVATLNLNLPTGTNIITYYINQAGYDNLKRNFKVIVVPSSESQISSDIKTVYQGAKDKFIITLSAGNVKIPNQIVTFTINGVEYNRTTDLNGIARITINLAAGEYDIKCSYQGNLKLKNISKIFHLTVIKRLNTNLEFIGNNVQILGSVDKFQVRLTDEENNNLANQQVIFNLNGAEHIGITNNDGIALLDISNLNMGYYEIEYKFDEFGRYLQSKGSSSVRILSSDFKGNGYWLWGAHMYKVDLQSLARQGTTDIFLLSAAISTHGQNNVVQWIKKANSYGIRVHIWMLTFYDGNFISPVLSDGTPNYDVINKKISDAKYYASLPGVSGIHLDYVRFPGTAYKHPGGLNAINEFVKNCGEAIKAINPNIIYSAAVMPEPSSNVYYYGQDVSTMGKYLDVIIPMVYKGNYHSGTNWIGSTTKWFVEHSSGAKIWTGLQAYESDDRVVPLSVSELTNDARVAVNNGASGAVLFRWGVTNFIDFNSIY